MVLVLDLTTMCSYIGKLNQLFFFKPIKGMVNCSTNITGNTISFTVVIEAVTFVHESRVDCNGKT
jgi:hypothetical protein